MQQLQTYNSQKSNKSDHSRKFTEIEEKPSENQKIVINLTKVAWLIQLRLIWEDFEDAFKSLSQNDLFNKELLC